jgi:hypothetical protein
MEVKVTFIASFSRSVNFATAEAAGTGTFDVADVIVVDVVDVMLGVAGAGTVWAGVVDVTTAGFGLGGAGG